jgi:hypothetical protein
MGRERVWALQNFGEPVNDGGGGQQGCQVGFGLIAGQLIRAESSENLTNQKGFIGIERPRLIVQCP